MSEDEVKDLATFVEPLPDAGDDSGSFRRVLCGDCGWWPSSSLHVHTCPKCGGHAAPMLTIKELKELCTKRLTELFERRGEVFIPIVLPKLGLVRSQYLEDVAGAFDLWPPAEQAAYYIAIAFGQECERWCKKCGNLKPECPCEEK